MEGDEIKSSKINKKQLLIVVGCFLLFVLSAFLLYRVRFISKARNFIAQSIISNEIKVATSTPVEVVAPKDLVRRQIDGVLVEKGKENILPIAIMIDNHVDARPQSGLSSANIVYEAEAEGGITRFLAIFASGDKVDEIGPVRSAREYYIDWATEYNALYVHCGGSPEALAQIIKEDVFDLNQFYHGGDFWRDDNRPAPHNVMTSSDKLNNYLAKKKTKASNYDSWLWKDDSISTSTSSQVADIKIYYSGGFAVIWKYDIINNIYTRFLNTSKHLDKQGGELLAKNIILETVSSQVVDEKKRLKMNDIGEGKAVICLDGLCQVGVWKKANKNSRTKYYINNKEAYFNAGTTWIEVVRPGISLEY